MKKCEFLLNYLNQKNIADRKNFMAHIFLVSNYTDLIKDTLMDHLKWKDQQSGKERTSINILNERKKL